MVSIHFNNCISDCARFINELYNLNVKLNYLKQCFIISFCRLKNNSEPKITNQGKVAEEISNNSVRKSKDYLTT